MFKSSSDTSESAEDEEFSTCACNRRDMGTRILSDWRESIMTLVNAEPKACMLSCDSVVSWLFVSNKALFDVRESDLYSLSDFEVQGLV